MRIFHPTDLSGASEVAFTHAIKLALAGHGELTIFHVAREAEAEEDIRSLGAADAAPADLLVLTTHGKHGFLDALRGSTTEHVIRRARCPVLAVPTLPSDVGILVSES